MRRGGQDGYCWSVLFLVSSPIFVVSKNREKLHIVQIRYKMLQSFFRYPADQGHGCSALAVLAMVTLWHYVAFTLLLPIGVQMLVVHAKLSSSEKKEFPYVVWDIDSAWTVAKFVIININNSLRKLLRRRAPDNERPKSCRLAFNSSEQAIETEAESCMAACSIVKLSYSPDVTRTVLEARKKLAHFMSKYRFTFWWQFENPGFTKLQTLNIITATASAYYEHAVLGDEVNIHIACSSSAD